MEKRIYTGKDADTREEVTVVIPVFNREDIVVETLESVKAQTYRPLRLILVDNNSTDGTLSAVEAWKAANEDEGFRVKVVVETKPGAAAARNRGLEETRTDKLMFFDSDDLMKPGMIELGMEEYRKNPDLMLAYWRHEREDIDGKRGKSHFTTGDKLECHLVHSMLNTASYLAKREYVSKAGGWNEDLRVWDDYELGARLLLMTPESKGIDRCLYVVKSRAESITGTEFSSRAGEWEDVLDKIMSGIKASSHPDRERYMRIVDYRRIILAAHYAKEGSLELARNLKRDTLRRCRMSALQKLLLRFVYAYTRRGGRGAWMFSRWFL
jgi:Glycosyltransferases involved in cell wall biogenesis